MSAFSHDLIEDIPDTDNDGRSEGGPEAMLDKCSVVVGGMPASL